jgi:hypothetical protein
VDLDREDEARDRAGKNGPWVSSLREVTDAIAAEG